MKVSSSCHHDQSAQSVNTNLACWVYLGIMSYILFFIILWFTWLQTTLYDIKFTQESFYERVFRGIHFAVMVGFASVSTSWDPLNQGDGRSASNLQSMSLTLMVSRFALGIQYAVKIVDAFKHKTAAVPFAIHSFVMFGAGLIYMGVSKFPNFAFSAIIVNMVYIALHHSRTRRKYHEASKSLSQLVCVTEQSGRAMSITDMGVQVCCDFSRGCRCAGRLV